MAARQSVPVIGAQSSTYRDGVNVSPYLGKGKWQTSFGFRYQNSARHFTGIHEDTSREAEQSEVINWIYLADFSATYGLTTRTNLSLSVPFLFADRSSPLRQGGVTVSRSTTHSRGISDMSLMSRSWIFDPETHRKQNLSLGIGVKFPTGNPAVSDTFRGLTSSTVHNVDQSIMPGDGKFGMVVDMQAFKSVWKLTLSTGAIYLINPANTNGELTARGRASESVFSVPDQYLLRLGAAMPVLPKQGIALSLAGRMEGVPVHDLIGGSDGFRRPGYAISIEPGILFSLRNNLFSLSAPVALKRNRLRSVPDIQDGRAGDAAFADSFLIFGYTHRF